VSARVGFERVVDANSKVSAANSVMSVVGPSLGGLLVQLLTAPIAVLADAVSYLISAVSLTLIRRREAEAPAAPQRHLRQEIVEGLTTVVRDPTLRTLALTISGFNLFNAWMTSVYVLYAVRGLGLTPVQLGIVFGAVGPGALLR
jgi:Na+/melibiose symporter-like transporter